MEDRETIIQMCIEEGLGELQVEIIFAPRDAWELRRAQCAIMNQEAFQLYFPRGVLPITEDPLSIKPALYTEWCIPLIVEQTTMMREVDLVRYLLYWTVRVKFRIVREVEFEKADISTDDDHLIEELVESDMIAAGYPRWWTDLLV